MGSLSGLFDLSRRSLASDQLALSATANNVANQNTAGYVRQVATWQSGDLVTLSGSSGTSPTESTTGPVVTITSKRDRVLEQRVQQQTQIQAATGARAAVLSQVEDVFSPSGVSASVGATQIGSATNQFFASLTALAASPSDPASRQSVLNAAQSVASAFNTAASQLTQIGNDLNGQLASSVDAVNGLTTTIARLNGQIAENSPGQDAGPLEDQRQQAIAQLSQYVGLDQVSTEANGITLTTQGGTALVAGTRAYSLSAVNTGGRTEIRDSRGNDASASIIGGSVGGQLVAQNLDIPAVQGGLDALAFRFAGAVNTANAHGATPGGGLGGPIFAAGVTVSGAAAALSLTAGSAGIAANGIGEGSSGSTNALVLAQVQQIQDASGLTIGAQFGGLLAQVGTQSSSLKEQDTAQTASLAQLTGVRDSLSAVSLDQEAANLTQYQRSYQAAAKLFSIVDSLLTSAINLGQQTTVS